MRRVIKFKTFFSLRNTKGYTIVELLVVMGIIAILLPLTFGGYNGVRKQKYVQHVANTAQTEIRGTFIDTIATKVENGGGCNNQAPKIKVLRIKLAPSDNPISSVSFCENSAGVLQSSSINARDSSTVGYRQNLLSRAHYKYGSNSYSYSSITCPFSDRCNYLNLIFTSPYGNYWSYVGTDYDNASGLQARLADTTKWIKNMDTQIYSPTDTEKNNVMNKGDVTVFFNSDIAGGSGIVHKITISENGSVKLD